MNRILSPDQRQRLAQFGRVAEDIMSPNPVSIDQNEMVRHAATVLTERSIKAVPVISTAGRPVGVISWTDILRVAGGGTSNVSSALVCEYCARPTIVPQGADPAELDRGMCDCPTVSDTMTPDVISVGKDASVMEIIEKLLGENVNRVFVIDNEGTLVGVVTALDVIRSLRRCTTAA